MRAKKIPILDFDPAPTAIIEPGEIIRKRDYSKKVVLCFFSDVIEKLVSNGKAVRVDRLKSEMGENPIYQVDQPDGKIMVVNPCVGAPLAGAFFEEMIARGCDQFIACGGCGVLDPAFKVGHVLIPTEAVRDEGTSYAYLPAGERVFPSANALTAIKRALEKHTIPYDEVKTWTTDAIYRETADLVRLRKKQGCKVVEMESAAFFAIAKFRNVQFGQLLYGGDSVHESGWDDREWSNRDTIREQLFWLAAESVLGM